MDKEQDLVAEIHKIHLLKTGDHVSIDNTTRFPLVGKGEQGAVFQIDDLRCVKVYFDKADLDRELYALQSGEGAGIFPKVYITGDRFIVMEYLEAPSLDEYLKNHALSKELANSIIKILDTFESLGFTRFDQFARHLFVFSEEEIKVIDMVYAMQEKPACLPKRLLRDLGIYVQDFIEFTHEISPKWHERWVNHPDFERVMEKAKRKANQEK